MIVAGASAYPRIIDFANSVRLPTLGGRISYGWYGSHRRSCCRRRSSEPCSVLWVRYNNNTQNSPWSSWRSYPLPWRICKADWQGYLPNFTGRSSYACYCRKGCLLRRGIKAWVQGVRQKIVSNCKALGRRTSQRGNKLVSGGTDNHVLLMDLVIQM